VFWWIAAIAAVLLAVLIAVTLFTAGVIKPSNGSASKAGINVVDMPASCSVMYYALDPANTATSNPAKEVPYAVGTPVTARDEKGIKAELKERRECGADGKFDPELTATHYADWSDAGLTKQKLAYADIDAFVAKISTDHKLYASVVTELETLENDSKFSTESVPAGIWSVYVVPDGKGGLTTHVGKSAHVGTAAVFTHGDKVIKYRLECGFQILHQKPPKGLPQCTVPECKPPTPPTCQQTGTCSPPVVCKYNPALPPDSPLCHESKDHKVDVGPTQGTSQLGADAQQPVAPPAKASPLSPVTTHTADPVLPVAGAAPAPPVTVPAPVATNAPAPADPGPISVDPDSKG
jgi:hypothetical protein